MTTQSLFDAALFAFLEALRSNNNREWFQAHRQHYERDVRGPMLRFIGDVGPHLWQISPRFIADAQAYLLRVPESALAGLRDPTGMFFPNDDSLIDHAAEIAGGDAEQEADHLARRTYQAFTISVSYLRIFEKICDSCQYFVLFE